MNIIVELRNELSNYDTFIELNSIKDYIKKVIQSEYSNKKDIYISLLLTDDYSIKIINREYRNIDKPTDVISFAYLDTETDIDFGIFFTLGDIVISLETIQKQSIEYNQSFKKEFYYILTHGILHLLGYDHMNSYDKKIMRKKEEYILKKYRDVINA